MLAEQEHQQRHQARQRRLLHEAQLPVPKTLADYDWNAIPDLERPQIEQLAHDTGWLDRAENLLLFGPSGVGKTHLAAGICRSLIALDRTARFFSATTLVQKTFSHSLNGWLLVTNRDFRMASGRLRLRSGS